MPPKPHRAILDRVTGYADEASAFLRRRRLTRRPFARVYLPGGRGIAPAPRPRRGASSSSPPRECSTRRADGRRAPRRRRARPPDRRPRARPRRRFRRALLRGPVRLLALDRRVAHRARPAGVGPRRRGARGHGETTYFAHVDGLAEADLERAADAAAAALSGDRRRAAGARRRRARRRPGDRDRSRGGPARAQGRAAARLRRARPRCRRRGDPGAGRLLGGAPADHGRQLRRPLRRRRSHPGAARGPGGRRRDGTVETGFETLGGHRGFELVEGGAGEAIAERAAPAALTLLDAGPAPPGRCRSSSATASAASCFTR